LEPAVRQVEAWMESPILVFLYESDGHWKDIRNILQTARVWGTAKVSGFCSGKLELL
jgi:hypothetical protein